MGGLLDQVIQALFLRAFLLQPHRSGLFVYLYEESFGCCYTFFIKIFLAELLMKVYSSIKIYSQQVWISFFWGADINLAICSNRVNLGAKADFDFSWFWIIWSSPSSVQPGLFFSGTCQKPSVPSIFLPCGPTGLLTASATDQALKKKNPSHVLHSTQSKSHVRKSLTQWRCFSGRLTGDTQAASSSSPFVSCFPFTLPGHLRTTLVLILGSISCDGWHFCQPQECIPNPVLTNTGVQEGGVRQSISQDACKTEWGWRWGHPGRCHKIGELTYFLALATKNHDRSRCLKNCLTMSPATSSPGEGFCLNSDLCFCPCC